MRDSPFSKWAAGLAASVQGRAECVAKMTDCLSSPAVARRVEANRSRGAFRCYRCTSPDRVSDAIVVTEPVEEVATGGHQLTAMAALPHHQGTWYQTGFLGGRIHVGRYGRFGCIERGCTGRQLAGRSGVSRGFPLQPQIDDRRGAHRTARAVSLGLIIAGAVQRPTSSVTE